LAPDLVHSATSDLFAKILDTPAAQSLVGSVEKGGVLSCTGISQAAQAFLAVFLQNQFPNRPIVVVIDQLRIQETFQQDIATWMQARKSSAGGTAPAKQNPAVGRQAHERSAGYGSKDKAHTKVEEAPATADAPPATQTPAPLFFPAWEILPHDQRLPHVDVIGDRLETLVALSKAKQDTAEPSAAPSPLIVTSVTAVLQRTFARDALQAQVRSVQRGEQIEPLDLVEWLEDQGYEPEAQVTQKGEIALRGGILDVFPLTSPWPVRLEFFGNEVESLRYFDPLTQMSREEIDLVTIPPAGELGLLKRQLVSPGANLTKGVQTTGLGTLLDYLPSDTIFLCSEPDRLQAQAEAYEAQVPENDPLLINWAAFRQEAVPKGMTILQITEAGSDLSDRQVQPSAPDFFEGESLSWDLQSLEAFRPLAERAPDPQVAQAQRKEFFAQIHRWLRQGYEVHLFCNNDGERQRFMEIWDEYGLANPKSDDGEHHRDAALSPSGLRVHLGSLARGFLSDQAKAVVVTDAEIFGRYKVQRPRRLKSLHAQAARSALDIDFTDLEEGDYVVHLQHGIGRYAGLTVLPMGAGRKSSTRVASVESEPETRGDGQECLVIEYAPNDPTQPAPKLYVPITEAHLVSKYVGTGKARPPLNTLGGTRWAKAKAQAEHAVRDVASDLLTIQAARESQVGYAFKPDTGWQREFESAFLFEETPDQSRAISETKTDMERPKPMDRLICGDVGFGKTEVGIRAAFKAVMDGKQVAVLVPTTVLAQQHCNTFRERMADYPVRIELLSRFRTRRAQQKVVNELAAGSVDIVIGTHRLLQGDIAFRDLGLVVIDEEQRFGVMHKERFKMLRRLVDVLTLSATPIPRTLYLALTGARDMSTIQTPPHDRLPVETIVTQYDERIIRDAINRELNRGGQVFFLHNRVLTIETMAQKLASLVPHACIVVGHGQMHSDDLEEVMTKFVNGEADVLLSTTIIESGLDIPNANTIIIDRADRFGLSDLYQLRGRVGRYKHQAYAYLLLPRHAGLLADARKRLSAIKQYSTLGSGFKIAMRDLEIRGAGNLLGAEQSGHITAVGFELYCQLLKQSIAGLKGEKVKPRVEVEVRLDFIAFSPADEAKPLESSRNKAQKQLAADVASESEAREASALSERGQGAKRNRAPSKHELASGYASAHIPFSYISDSRQRIELYRKIAQATDRHSLQSLEKELRDRFGALPAAVTLLLRVAELKILAAERRVTSIEVKEDKLMLRRNDDYVMVGSKFPRLTKRDAPGRVKEIKKLLMVL
jgi:transcription-repair coupling factor (superfamily II helicase)